ncbi:D-alanyl-D-alanine carboxypeptidase [Clostridia bacterium OttesenSCG-928-F22]|nr:D-alanyl-D-alanine carboxypeptidase [Clostridia bacterium OttesenSCG-928-F22]
MTGKTEGKAGDKMKKYIGIIITVLMLFAQVAPVQAMDLAPAATTAEVTGTSAVLLEVETGRLLYAKNADKQMPMASTTKVMTAILAIENGVLEDVVTISGNASGVEGSSLYLAIGQKVTLEQLLYGLMLQSGNDSAVAIAEHIAGSVEEFAGMMNAKARELGAENTNFMNPHGLPASGHHTTAADLAKITAYAMQNETFEKIVSTKYHELDLGEGQIRVIKNKNKVLWDYEGGIGVKTGYTKEAGRCLVSAAKRDNMTTVAVVLDCYDWFEQSMKLLDYGFETYRYYNVLEKGTFLQEIAIENGIQPTSDIFIEENVSIPLTQEEYNRLEYKVNITPGLKAPVTAGTEVGTIEIWLDGNMIVAQTVQINEDIGELTYGYYLNKILNYWKRPAIGW